MINDFARRLVTFGWRPLDPTAEVTSRVNNCIRAKRRVTRIGNSKFKLALVKILEKVGCVTRVSVIAKGGRRAELIVGLKYMAGRPMMRGVKQISRPGRREYWTVRQAKFASESPAETFILSTNVGLREANKSLTSGGEVVCKVKW
ncbi:MAG: 30S ribosomal protein S8 [Candidatus Hodgkinia cicadicola]